TEEGQDEEVRARAGDLGERHHEERERGGEPLPRRELRLGAEDSLGERAEEAQEAEAEGGGRGEARQAQPPGSVERDREGGAGAEDEAREEGQLERALDEAAEARELPLRFVGGGEPEGGAIEAELGREDEEERPAQEDAVGAVLGGPHRPRQAHLDDERDAGP